ncbi:MAG: carbonic anhydrase [Bacteroidales bacterium]|nr:carbonic anhydrase [Bacteroidales bacterium]
MRTHNQTSQQSLTPTEALEFLKAGNQRFVGNLSYNRNLLQQVNETSDGQFPFAVVLSCIDSRTSAELIFDQGLGDIFSVRIAGNVLNDDILGSMEFACNVAGSKLVVVLGHSKCGAVKGACAHVEMGHLTGLLDKIQPSVNNISMRQAKLDEAAFVEEVASENVRLQMEAVLERSSILRGLYEEGKIGVVGAMYSVETGEVAILSELFNQPVVAAEMEMLA